MGRRVSEASPSSVVSNGRPASRPVSMRIVVPEFPQSSARAAARRPAKPTPRTSASVPARRMPTPSASSAARRRTVVAALAEAADLDGAVAQRAEEQRAV